MFVAIHGKGTFCAEKKDLTGENYLFVVEDATNSDIAEVTAQAIGDHVMNIYPNLKSFPGYGELNITVRKVASVAYHVHEKELEWSKK